MSSSTQSWWQHGVIYQVYPRSFQDTTGSGTGDLRGIIQRLDYIQELGVSAIWLNPFYESPMADFGYDISDYDRVDPLFGTNADLEELLVQAHRRGLKIILDLVLNHTSEKHPWFQESKSSRDNPKRDWYVWRDEPNNWESIFGGTAWEHDPVTQQYYYHAFLKEQPDLNLRNPEVTTALHEMVRRYLELGVDGFRLDATNTFFEDAEFRDNPEKCYHPEPEASLVATQERVHNYDHELNFTLLDDLSKLVHSYPNRMLVGEVGREGKDTNAWKEYYGACDERLDLVFNFDLLYGELSAERFRKTITLWEGIPDCKWPSYTFSSHDQIRGVSKFKPAGLDHKHRAKLLALFLLTVRGTPFVYYGDELGLEEVTPLPKEAIQDPWAIRNDYQVPTRDGCRTPMLWDTTEFAGFSASRPWLPVHGNFAELNVKTQTQDSDSILNFYRELIALRQATPALYEGKLELREAGFSVCQFTRTYKNQVYRVTINLGSKPVRLQTPGNVLISAELNADLLGGYGYCLEEMSAK